MHPITWNYIGAKWRKWFKTYWRATFKTVTWYSPLEILSMWKSLNHIVSKQLIWMALCKAQIGHTVPTVNFWGNVFFLHDGHVHFNQVLMYRVSIREANNSRKTTGRHWVFVQRTSLKYLLESNVPIGTVLHASRHCMESRNKNQATVSN